MKDESKPPAELIEWIARQTGQKTEPAVRSSEMVSLCGLAMSEDAKRKMLELIDRGNTKHMSDVLDAFRIGFREGRSAQANDPSSATGANSKDERKTR